MKKLLLTSSGTNSNRIRKELIKIIPKNEDKNALVLYWELYPKYIKKVKKELLGFKFKKENIVFAKIGDKKFVKGFSDFDVLYFMGGETFVILKMLRKTGFDKLVSKFVNSGKLFIGASASSIIAGPSIEIASWGKTGEDHLAGLKPSEWKGLNFTNISIFPHYEDKLKKEIPAFKKKINNKYPVLPLRDEQALLIIGDKKIILR